MNDRVYVLDGSKVKRHKLYEVMRLIVSRLRQISPNRTAPMAGPPLTAWKNIICQGVNDLMDVGVDANNAIRIANDLANPPDFYVVVGPPGTSQAEAEEIVTNDLYSHLDDGYPTN